MHYPAALYDLYALIAARKYRAISKALFGAFSVLFVIANILFYYFVWPTGAGGPNYVLYILFEILLFHACYATPLVTLITPPQFGDLRELTVLKIRRAISFSPVNYITIRDPISGEIFDIRILYGGKISATVPGNHFFFIHPRAVNYSLPLFVTDSSYMDDVIEYVPWERMKEFNDRIRSVPEAPFR